MTEPRPPDSDLPIDGNAFPGGAWSGLKAMQFFSLRTSGGAFRLENGDQRNLRRSLLQPTSGTTKADEDLRRHEIAMFRGQFDSIKRRGQLGGRTTRQPAS